MASGRDSDRKHRRALYDHHWRIRSAKTAPIRSIFLTVSQDATLSITISSLSLHRFTSTKTASWWHRSPRLGGVLGNNGRNQQYGPRLVDFDFSVIKNTYVPKISESFSV